MICYFCGRKSREGAKFCAGCGFPLIEGAEVIKITGDDVTDDTVNVTDNTDNITIDITDDSDTEDSDKITDNIDFIDNSNIIDNTVSVSEFLLMRIIALIPIIGLIYLIYIIFKADNINIKNHAKASIIMSIFTALLFLAFGLGIYFAYPIF